MTAPIGRLPYTTASDENGKSPSGQHIPTRGATLRSNSLTRFARDHVLSSIEESSSSPVPDTDGVSDSIEEVKAWMAEMDAKINRFLETRLLSSIYDAPRTNPSVGSARRWSTEGGISPPVIHYYRDIPRQPKGTALTQNSARAAGVEPSRVKTNTTKSGSVRGIRNDSSRNSSDAGLGDRIKGWVKRAHWQKKSMTEAPPVFNPWSPIEDGKMLALLKQGRSLKQISKALPLHSPEDCRKRWEDHLQTNRVHLFPEESPVQDRDQDAITRV